LSENNLGIDSAVNISKVLRSSNNIHTLILKRNPFHKEGFNHIIKALSENTTLKCIDLSYIIKNTKKVKEVLRSLSDLLSRKTSALDTLLFCGEEKQFIGKDLADIFPAVGASMKLSSLDISGQRMGDKCATLLPEALRTNTSLTYLNWDGNEVNYGGYQAFASCLKSNKTLQNIPPPLNDIERAISESKEKKKVKEKFHLLMSSIYDTIESNTKGVSSHKSLVISALSGSGTLSKVIRRKTIPPVQLAEMFERNETSSFILEKNPSESNLASSTEGVPQIPPIDLDLPPPVIPEPF